MDSDVQTEQDKQGHPENKTASPDSHTLLLDKLISNTICIMQK